MTIAASAEQPPGGADHDRPARRGRDGPARRPRSRLGPCARHLDGRDGRPGARARASRAHPHAHARLHLLRRRGQRARPLKMSCGGSAEARMSRAIASARSAPPGRATSLRPSRPTTMRGRAFWRSACAGAVAVAVIMAQLRAIAAHDTSRAAAPDRDADARRPRHARRADSGPERSHDRRAHTRRRAWRSSRTSATCSSGSGPSARPSWCARTPPCMPDRSGAVELRVLTDDGVGLAGEQVAEESRRARARRDRAAARPDRDASLCGDGLARARALRPTRDRL